MKGVSSNANDISLFLIEDISWHEPPATCTLQASFSPMLNTTMASSHFFLVFAPVTHNPVCQEPITRSVQIPIIPVTVFSQTDLL